jgi:hypothetical protein
MKATWAGIAAAVVGLTLTAWAGGPSNESVRISMELTDGSRLIGTPGLATVPVQTSYAKMDVPLTQIQALKIGNDHETVTLDLRNGDTLTGVISLKPIELKTLFGPASIGIEHIKRFQVLSGDSMDGVLKTSILPAGWVVTDIPPRQHSFSISFWMYAKSIANYNAMVASGETMGYGGQGVLFYENAPKLFGNTADNWTWGTTMVGGTTSLSTGVWYHVAWTHQESGFNKFYVNGQLEGQKATGPNTGGYTDVYCFGALNRIGAWLYNGYLDDIAIWDRALSPTEVLSIFGDRKTSPSVIAPDSVVDVFRFNTTNSISGEKGGTGTKNGVVSIVGISEI